MLDIIKEGQFFILSCGSYDDHTVTGLFRAKKTFQLDDVTMNVHYETSFENYNNRKIKEFLINDGLAEKIECLEWLPDMDNDLSLI
jgi:hypothetical protein